MAVTLMARYELQENVIDRMVSAVWIQSELKLGLSTLAEAA
jgi:hypothetical protein